VLFIFVKFCIFVRSCYIGGFSVRESFSTVHSTATLFFCRVTAFLLSHYEDQIFADVCHFPVYISFACVQYHRLNACVQSLLQRTYLQLQQTKIITPSFILLLLFYALRVSSREPIHASFSKGGILI